MKVINVNIGSPSIGRAIEQLIWLRSFKDCDVFVLTEAKENAGCQYIINGLRIDGYDVNYNFIDNNDYSVIIASKIQLKSVSVINSYFNLPNRVAVVEININDRKLVIMGVYVPSNDKRKNTRKKTFMQNLISYLREKACKEDTLLIGDFNTVSRSHSPKYNMFRSWEYDFFDELKLLGMVDVQEKLYPNTNAYSWFGRTGNAYKYDYIFASLKLLDALKNVSYSGAAKALNLTDHYEVILELEV